MLVVDVRKEIQRLSEKVWPNGETYETQPEVFSIDAEDDEGDTHPLLLIACNRPELTHDRVERAVIAALRVLAGEG